MEMRSKLYLEKLLACAGIRDAAELSERIMSKFGTLYTVIQTESYKLVDMGFDPKAVELIRIASALTSRRITDRFKSGKRYSDQQIREFIAGLLFSYTVETVYMLSFDKDGKFIVADLVDAGTVNSSGVIPRKILDIVLRRKAKKIILAHNHPCGRPAPSDNDIMTTATVKSVCESAGIELLAHYVTAGFDMYECVSNIKCDYSEERVLCVSADIKGKI